MIRTYEIELDETLVNQADEIFNKLGSDIDSAIKMFLTQSVLRKGFPFDVTVPEVEPEDPSENEAGLSSQESIKKDIPVSENKNTVSSVSDEVAARVAANEALVEQLKDEIGENADAVPEFEPGEEEKLAENQKADMTAENSESQENATSEDSDSDEEEEEDETLPENLFDAWESGEEEIGCR